LGFLHAIDGFGEAGLILCEIANFNSNNSNAAAVLRVPNPGAPFCVLLLDFLSRLSRNLPAN
jgi:hypothetical protein